jgi:hypothetical protein
MVDQESRSYRPRRAFIEPEPEPTPPPAPAPAPAPATTGRPLAPNFDDEDAPKPLYRDEYLPRTPYRDQPAPGNGTRPAVNGGSPHPPAPPRPDADEVGSDDTAIRSFTFAPRTRRADDTGTTILGRSGSTARGRAAPSGPSGPDDLDDYDEDEEDGRPIGDRARWALIIGAIAAVVVLGLAIGYAVIGLGNQPMTTPPPAETAGSVDPGPTTSASAPPANGALLTNDMMLTAAQAKQLDTRRSWKEALTQRGASEDAPAPACFGGEPEQGQPVSQQKILRVLSSDGKGAPGALHDATAYATADEAAQAFATASRTLGTCPAASAYIVSGQSVRGVGDQATGAVVAVVDGKTTTAHSVVISRTGRVLNILDASRPGNQIPPGIVGTAVGEVTEEQCGPAGGKCDSKAEVRSGPPPLGGDQPGFLAVGDLPPVAGSVAPWNAAPVELPQEDFVGASCENVNWSTVPAESREMRVYLHPDSGTAYFGVNQIVLTLKDAKAASELVEKIKTDIEDCKDRRLTATVSDPKKVSGLGARNIKVTGYTVAVEQKGTDGSDEFRVGIVQADKKVAYTFANPQGDFNFSDDQWNTIAVRAGERVTQVN